MPIFKKRVLLNLLRDVYNERHLERGEILKGFRNHAISETFDSRSTASFVGRLNVEKCAYIIQDTYIHAYIYIHTRVQYECIPLRGA